MDRIAALRSADHLARSLRRMGLGRLSATGREVVRRLVKDRLEINWRGLRLSGRLQHRNYLAYLRGASRETFMLDLFVSRLESGGVVLDIGAYIGAYALLAGSLVGPTGKVVAFEPDPRNFETLARNVHMNGLDSVVTIVEAACGEKNGGATFWLNPGDWSASSLFRPYRDAQPSKVKVIRLDDAFPTLQPSIIKIDAEGAELGILNGMRDLIRRSPRLVIFCECNPSALATAGTTPHELLNELNSLGFRPMAIDETTRGVREPANINWERIKYVNLLCER